LITKTGWTLEYINTSLTLPEAEELLDYWNGSLAKKPKTFKPEESEEQMAVIQKLLQGETHHV